MFIVSSDKYKVSKGGAVTVQGVGFNDLCKVRINGVNYDPLDYSDEFISFAAPNDAGTFEFVILDGTSTTATLTLYVEEFEDLPTNRLKNRGESSFLRSLESLMPRGFAWEFGVESNWHKLWSAVALVFAYLYGLLKELVTEMSPYSTTSYGTWENELQLPIAGLEQSTLSGRKSEIVRISRRKGGATIPYLKSILDLYGVRYDLYEYWQNPEVFPQWVAANGDQANFFVLVKIYSQTYYKYGANCKSPCTASLGRQRDRKLESILNRIKPAHIKIVYSYVVQVLTDMNGNPIVDDNNRMIIV